MKIALSADHRGSAAIRQLHEKLRREGKDAAVVGECGGSTCDYPEMAFQVAKAVADGTYDLGVLICGTGIGMSIAANKVSGVRAALVHDELTAQMSKRHNNANVLCLPADLVGDSLMQSIVRLWLQTEFEGGRHERRLDKIAAFEQGRPPCPPPTTG